MKASESVSNYASTVRMYTNYTVREIKKICKNIGPRIAGSQQEYDAHKYIAEEMKTCCDKVDIEEFKLSPEAFMSWVRIDSILVILAIILSFVGRFTDIPQLSYVSLGLTFIALVCLFCEFLMYLEFYDALFKKAVSHNTIGVRYASGEAKQRIIFSGHVDSSHEWTYTHLGGKLLLFAVGGYGVVAMLYVFAVSVFASFGIFSNVMISESMSLLELLQWIQLAFVPAIFLVFFFINFKRTVEGANDNLTGTMASVAIMKFLKDNDIRFENTEVVALASGAEESGLRGARNYTKRHMDELNEIPTIFVGLETLRDYDSMAIYQRDMTGTVKMDGRVCALLKKAGQEAGLELPYSSVYIGASDAAAVQKLGVPAVTFAAMDPGPPRYYHTRGDTADNMDMKTVEKCLEVAFNTLFLYDEEGLKESY